MRAQQLLADGKCELWASDLVPRCRNKLRALRKTRVGNAKAARAVAGGSAVAQAAADLFIRQAADAHQTKKRRPGDGSALDVAAGGARSVSAPRVAAPPPPDAAPTKDQVRSSRGQASGHCFPISYQQH